VKSPKLFGSFGGVGALVLGALHKHAVLFLMASSSSYDTSIMAVTLLCYE